MHAMRQELTAEILDAPPDHAEYCVSRLTTIAHGEEGLEQRFRDAETQIADLLSANASGWFIILQRLTERLRSELYRHDGSSRGFLAGIVEFLNRHLERARAA